MIFGTKSVENETRDPIQKQNDFGDEFYQSLIDFGVPLGGPGKAFFLKNGWRSLAILDFCIFLFRLGGPSLIS